MPDTLARRGVGRVTNLPTLEQELHERLIEYEALSAAWPRGRTAMERYRIGKRHEQTLARIAELEAAIASAKAVTLEDAAVQLRRVLARLHDASLKALVLSALGAVGSCECSGWV